MSKIAFVFPGQGAQAVGMGRDLYESNARAKAVFDEADAALGFPLSDIVFNGPDEALKQTANTQPALPPPMITKSACSDMLSPSL